MATPALLGGTTCAAAATHIDRAKAVRVKNAHERMRGIIEPEAQMCGPQSGVPRRQCRWTNVFLMRRATMFRRFSGLVLVSILAISGLSQEGSAQSFILDARRVALGGSGSNDNLASKVVAEHQPYRVIPIPLGVFQICLLYTSDAADERSSVDL